MTVTERFSIDIKVRGQGRPRFTKAGRAYKDKRDVVYEKAIRDAFVDQCTQRPDYTGRVAIDIMAFKTLPKSVPKHVESRPWTEKPDASNLCKSVEDALNGVAWVDDSQVVRVVVEKADETRETVNGMNIDIHYLDLE